MTINHKFIAKKLTLILGFYYLTICIPALSQSLMGDRVQKANDWDQLFIRNDGWFGGDGIFGIPLDGKEFVPATEDTETLLTFGDTMIGSFTSDTLKRGDFTMIHNSVGLLKGKVPTEDKIEFHWKKDDDKHESIFSPNTPSVGPTEYYWLGDGFVNIDADNTLYIFAYRIANISGGVFPFQQVGVSLIAIPQGSTPPYKNHTQIETPFFVQTENNGSQTSFGGAIYVNTKSAGAPKPDGYIYVYAVKGIDKQLLVTRVKPNDFTEFEKWRFWDGESWSEDIESAVAIAKNVSNEMSISPFPDGRILLTYQYMGMQPEIAIQVGVSPIGPFLPMKKVWYTEEINEDLDFFTYNAKAYPHLSSPGSVLISYNINSFDFWNDILYKPNLYRPRFIRLKLD